ncbi:MAG: hypothetical protein BWK74_07885 [Desulfobacteraceae bacterium A6]|nr:MAG: hypothetical protein BWK74_07885 [Desulfobacteraceae bacterium A6]
MKQSIKNLKKTQIEFLDSEIASRGDIRYEGNYYYHDYFRALPFAAVRRLLAGLDVTLNRKNVLIASCGTGIDVHYLRKHYDADLTVSDLSEKSVQMALKLNKNLRAGYVEDSEQLSFADESFDYVFIAASLHHLPRPLVGLYELIRVARYGVIVIESNDNWLTRLATRFKLATEIERAGNYVYRFSAWDIKRISRAIFYKCHYVCLFAIHRIAKSELEFLILKSLNYMANLLVPSLGNYIIFFIKKE